MSSTFPDQKSGPAGPAVRASSLGIRFNLDLERGVRLKEAGLGAFRSLLRRKKREFWALRDINLEIPRGEIFGVIGGNGAGKSTLLKIIAGIFPATEGDVATRGSLAPLIELGAAFNPELTGAENIDFTGSVYRIPRPVVRENFDRIVEFSGLRKFIHTPVKNYSSGMFLRLAFSTVIFFEPDIVLIDEVFAVGDEVFQQKSFEKILSFKEKGATILLVSHDLNLISQICGRVLLLHRGRQAFLGPAEEAVKRYHQLITSGEGIGPDTDHDGNRAPAADSRRWGTRQVEITAVRFADERGRFKNAFSQGEYFEAQISYVSRLQDGVPVFGVAINTIYKLLIYGPNTLEKEIEGEFKDRGLVRFIIPSLPLFGGDYLFSASAYDPTLAQAYDHHEMMYHFRVTGSGTRDFGCVRIDSRWKVEGA